MSSFFFQAIPEAVVSWKYKETEINNGSTLVNDIDMRQYYYGSRHVATCIKILTLFIPQQGCFYHRDSKATPKTRKSLRDSILREKDLEEHG